MDRELYLEHRDFEEKHWWFVARRKIIFNFLKKHLQTNNDCQVLEIGAGTGGNLKMLQSFGKLYAMELDADAVQYANEKNICQVKQGALPSQIPFQQKFDLIVMADVLEHIEDDAEALQAVKNLLKDDAKLLITVPAYQFLWSEHDVANHHYRRYTKKHLCSLLSQSGLHVKHSTYFNTFLFPVVLAIRTASQFIKSELPKSNINMPSKWMNQILKNIFQSETLFLSWLQFPFGVSFMVLSENQNS